MKNLKEHLTILKNRNEELSKIVFVGFNTDEELDDYRKTIKEEREEYYTNLKEIDRLEWELKTPEEQAREKEVSRKIKAKVLGIDYEKE